MNLAPDNIRIKDVPYHGSGSEFLAVSSTLFEKAIMAMLRINQYNCIRPIFISSSKKGLVTKCVNSSAIACTVLYFMLKVVVDEVCEAAAVAAAAV